MNRKYATLWSVVTRSGATVTMFCNNETRARVMIRTSPTPNDVPSAFEVGLNERVPEPRVGSTINTKAYMSTPVVKVLSN